MNLFKLLKEWINERASADIMEKRLALKDEEIAELKRQKFQLEAKIKDLELAQQKQKIEADEIRIHKGIQFRRGLKTGGQWAAFCPKCNLPAQQLFRTLFEKTDRRVTCSAQCGWFVIMDTDLAVLIDELAA